MRRLLRGVFLRLPCSAIARHNVALIGNLVGNPFADHGQLAALALFATVALLTALTRFSVRALFALLAFFAVFAALAGGALGASGADLTGIAPVAFLAGIALLTALTPRTYLTTKPLLASRSRRAAFTQRPTLACFAALALRTYLATKPLLANRSRRAAFALRPTLACFAALAAFTALADFAALAILSSLSWFAALALRTGKTRFAGETFFALRTQLAFLAALASESNPGRSLLASVAGFAFLASRTLLALRPGWTRFAVFQLDQPGLNPRFKGRDLRLQLADDRSGSCHFQFMQTAPLALLPLQRLGETDPPGVKE